jgi:hypothetical protein
MGTQFLAMVLISAMSIFGGVNETPSAKLNHALQHMGNRGDVGYQAKLDGFDYRRHLRKAIAGNQGAFAALFDYTSDGRLMGVGAQEHSEILYNLLLLWGDDFFSAVLRARRLTVQHRVVSRIDSRYPGWAPGKFPETYKLGPHHQRTTGQ